MNVADKLVLNQGEMEPEELMLWLGDAATLQDAHALISAQMDDWVPGASKFRAHIESISKEVEKAAAQNVTTTKELEQATAAAVHDVFINASYLVLREKQDKNGAWLHNNGYQSKDKPKRNYNKLVSALALLLKVKNGPGIQEVTASWDRDPAAGSYQLQICKGIPQGEESYADQGYYKKVRAVVPGLERASWYYFRVRSVGDNETGPWSEPVGIVVT